eukprot:Pgem_evm2s19469
MLQKLTRLFIRHKFVSMTCADEFNNGKNNNNNNNNNNKNSKNTIASKTEFENIVKDQCIHRVQHTKQNGADNNNRTVIIASVVASVTFLALLIGAAVIVYIIKRKKKEKELLNGKSALEFVLEKDPIECDDFNKVQTDYMTVKESAEENDDINIDKLTRYPDLNVDVQVDEHYINVDDLDDHNNQVQTIQQFDVNNIHDHGNVAKCDVDVILGGDDAIGQANQHYACNKIDTNSNVDRTYIAQAYANVQDEEYAEAHEEYADVYEEYAEST